MEDDAGEGFGGAADQFHRSEAISAVQDEDPYLGEEDDDYDDLYNDVNVGENFLQSLRRGEDTGGIPQTELEPQKAPEPLPPRPPSPLPAQRQPQAQPQQQQQQQQQPPQQAPPLPLPPPLQQPPSVFPERPTMIPGIGGEPPKMDRGVDGARGYPELGFRGPSEPAGMRAPASGFGGPRPEMGQPPPARPVPLQGQYGGANFPGDGFARQQGGAPVGGGGGGGAGMGGAVAGGVGGVGAAYNVNLNGGTGAGSVGVGGGGSGGTILFVGDLHWWTTDADLEAELCKYGQVKELKFFDERASGKSKGYCQVEFFDPMAATACKEGMNGHVFNGRPCVVAFASPNSVRRMGEAQVSKNQAMTQTQSAPSQPRGRGGGGGGGGMNTGGSHGRGGGGGGGGGGWGRGGGGMGGRGQVGGMRNRMGGPGGRGIMGNGGLVTPPPPPVMHPGAMLGQGFDPTGGYGAAMGRMAGGYAGFPGGPAGPPFPGMLPSFPPVVAPHVNPAFFGRGVPTGGVGMWSDPNAAGWGGEEQSSYGEDAVSDQHYGEVSLGKDRVSDRDWSVASDRRQRDDREKDMSAGHEWTERRHHDEREISRERERDRDRERDRERERERERDRERERYREDRERHGDHHRHKERELDRDEEWDRGRSSRARSRSREYDHSKRRRLSPR